MNIPSRETDSEEAVDVTFRQKICSCFRSQTTSRILLFYFAIIIKVVASALSAIGFVLHNAALMVVGTVVWLFFFVVLLLVAVPDTDRWLRSRIQGLKTAALTITIIILGVGFALLVITVTIGLTSIQSENREGIWSQLFVSLDNVFGYNDATALSHQAAENVLNGENPYARSNIVSAMIEYDGSIDKITPLREGRFATVFPYPDIDQLEEFWDEISATPGQVPPEIESRYNYPAGCFLLPAPFIWLGIDDFRIIYLILIIPALAYVVLRMRRDQVILLTGAVVISVELWYSLAAGETGYLYFPSLLLAWVLYRRNLWLSALFMAIAVATKQLTWFILLFYLILILRTAGDRKALGVLSIIVGVFAAVNLAFFIDDPGLWINSVLAPMIDDLFPLGVGIISVVTGGVLDIQSSLPFGILELCVLVIALVWYYFNCRRYPHAGLILAVLPLFFAWRSLWGYFYYIDIILLAAVMVNEYGKDSDGQNTLPSELD